MAAVTDEQFFFAIIKQLDGSIDWQKVADECNIVTKGAASKRFSRMKIKYEKGENAAGDATPTGEGTPGAKDQSTKAKKKSPVKTSPSKKRKVDEVTEEDDHENKVKTEDEEA